MALILPHMLICLPLVVWVMAPYFDSVPRELEEAAMVDGLTQQRHLPSSSYPSGDPVW